jgi:hypothetical protein
MQEAGDNPEKRIDYSIVPTANLRNSRSHERRTSSASCQKRDAKA